MVSRFLFGGTFDPFHNGHLHVLEAIDQLHDFPFIHIMPTNLSPHKIELAKGKSDPTPSQRLEMVKVACEGRAHWIPETYEIETGGISYTIYSLRHLVEKYPGQEWNLVIGSDAFFLLHTWVEVSNLLQACRISVIGRSPIQKEKVEGYIHRHFKGDDIPNFDFHFLPLVPVASSDIRERCRKSLSIDDLVPKSVAHYIHQQGLYT